MSVFHTVLSQSNGDSFKHIVLLSDGVTTPLTSGQYEVLQIYGWDLASNYVFYSANGVNASQQQHIYMIKAEKDASKREPYCMTCGVVRQTCFSASFSPDSKHMVLVMEGPSMPRADIFSWKIINSSELQKNKIQQTGLLSYTKRLYSVSIQHSFCSSSIHGITIHKCVVS